MAGIRQHRTKPRRRVRFGISGRDMARSGAVLWWSSLSLSRQFLVLSAILLLPALGFLGHWTSLRVNAAVKEDVGLRTSPYVRHLFAPYLPELAGGRMLSDESIAAISREIEAGAAGINMANTKLWSPEGRILFDTDPRLLGARFPVEGGLAEALSSGNVAVEFDDPYSKHSSYPGRKFLEVYVPLAPAQGGPVLAVAEAYHDTTSLLAMLTWTRTLTWVVAGAVAAVILAGTHAIVAGGDSVILRQRAELNDKVAELTRLLCHNQALRQRIQKASSLSAEDAALHLRRIGADIHDGIGQLLTIALLKLEQLVPDERARGRDYRLLHELLEDAMAEVRAMVSGLTLPLITERTLADAVTLVVMKHRHRTSTEVGCMIADDVGEAGGPVKLAICRMVQEGLNNAFRHAGAAGQSVTLKGDGPFIVVTVSDRGPGLIPRQDNARRQPLGLIGLRNRIVSLGGEFSISSVPGRGVTISGHFPREV